MGTTSFFPVTIANIGNTQTAWSAQVASDAPWLSLIPSSSTLEPGSVENLSLQFLLDNSTIDTLEEKNVVFLV